MQKLEIEHIFVRSYSASNELLKKVKILHIKYINLPSQCTHYKYSYRTAYGYEFKIIFLIQRQPNCNFKQWTRLYLCFIINILWDFKKVNIFALVSHSWNITICLILLSEKNNSSFKNFVISFRCKWNIVYY